MGDLAFLSSHVCSRLRMHQALPKELVSALWDDFKYILIDKFTVPLVKDCKNDVREAQVRTAGFLKNSYLA